MPAISLGSDSARISAAGRPFLLHRGGQVFTLGSGDLLQGIDRDVELAGEGLGRGSRHSILVGDLERRPGDLLGDVGLRGRDAGSQHGQAPRSGIGLQRRSFDKPLALQQIANAASQFVAGAIDHPRGNFFGTDFEKEVRHREAISN